MDVFRDALERRRRREGRARDVFDGRHGRHTLKKIRVSRETTTRAKRDSFL